MWERNTSKEGRTFGHGAKALDKVLFYGGVGCDEVSPRPRRLIPRDMGAQKTEGFRLWSSSLECLLSLSSTPGASTSGEQHRLTSPAVACVLAHGGPVIVPKSADTRVSGEIPLATLPCGGMGSCRTSGPDQGPGRRLIQRSHGTDGCGCQLRHPSGRSRGR